jgi:hypothetical protein
MPIVIKSLASEGVTYGNPFFGKALATDTVVLDISDLTADYEVDADNMLKPGLPLAKDGSTIASGVPVYGVVLEAVPLKHATDPATNASLAADTGTMQVTVGTHGNVNRDIVEDNLGRALTADEIAGFALAGSNLHLSRT